MTVENLYIHYDKSATSGYVEVWKSRRHYEKPGLGGLYGYLQRDVIWANTGEVRTLCGFPLALLQSYMRGMDYSIVLTATRMEKYVVDGGVYLPECEALFAPLVSEEHIELFARRCVEHGMFL